MTRVPLSILDLAPVSAGMTRAEALAASRQLAITADGRGYQRYWMAEHHSSETFLSSATSLLLGHLAEHTSRIRFGAGGVMLPNHAPLMVAEYYGTLATLYGDRFDLGLGRAPGTGPATARALRRGGAELRDFAADVSELAQYLGHARGDEDAAAAQARYVNPELDRVRAIPGDDTRVPLWMLGSSTGGAQVAAALGLPFSFASHFAPAQMRDAIEIYRRYFNADAPTAQVPEPYVMAGVNVLVAPSDEEAAFLYTSAIQLQAAIRTGRLGPIQPPVHDLDDVLDPRLTNLLTQSRSIAAVGSPATVVSYLEDFIAEFDLDELITATYTFDPALRIRSYEMLDEAWQS